MKKPHSVKSILIIDDSQTSREILRTAVKNLPYFETVLEAPDAMEGLAILEKNHIDFIISDIRMPGMNGFEFCKKVRTNPATEHIPVLLVTDKIELDTGHNEYLDSGADDYLTKPFHEKEIGARIHNILRIKAMKDEIEIHRHQLSRSTGKPEVEEVSLNSIRQINDEMSGKIHRLMKMLSIQLAIGEDMEFQELMELIIDKTKDVMEAEAASLMLLDPDRQELNFLIARSEKGEEVKRHRLRIGQGIAGWVAEKGEPVIINDVASDARFFADIDKATEFKTRNMICVPLRYKGRITGVIQVINKKREEKFRESELELFIEFSHQIAAAIENFSLLQQLKNTNEELIRRMEELSTLLQVQSALSSTLDLQDLLELIISKSKEVMRAEAASLMLLDAETDELVFQVAQGEAGDALKEIRIPVGEGIAGWVAQSGEPVLIADAQHDSRLYRKADERSRFITRNMICVPLKYKDRIIGVVQAINKIGTDTFRESEVGLFFGFASQAAMAIENVRLFNRQLAEEKARLDMRHILDMYVSPEVSETLIANPEKLKLGGSRQMVSMMFTDLLGFTSISESLEPEEVVSHLNDYFSDMVEIIFEHDGTLDKFMGDAIMALYGVPLQHGDDTRNAVLSAITMQVVLDKKRDVWRKDSMPPMYMGCGIHTGPAVVGNIGSARRKDYTVIGDAVNVAARLQQLTRLYRCGIIISEETYKLIGDEFIVRELDIIRVKGRRKPLKIYSVEIPELFGRQIIV